MEVTPSKRKREGEEEEGSTGNVRSSKREKTEEGPPTSGFIKLPVLVHNKGTSKPFSIPPILSRSVEIGVQLERYIEGACESAMNITELPMELMPCFTYLFGTFGYIARNLRDFKIKVFALDPSLISLKNNEKLYCFRLKLFVIKKGEDISIKPIRNNVPWRDDEHPPMLFRTRENKEVWDIDADLQNSDTKWGYFNCIALYDNDRFVRLLKVVTGNVGELFENKGLWSFLLQKFKNYQTDANHRYFVNTVCLLHGGKSEIFLSNDGPCFMSLNFPQTLFILGYYRNDKETMLWLKPIEFKYHNQIPFVLNQKNYINIHDLTLMENGKTDLVLLSQQYARGTDLSNDHDVIKITLNINHKPHNKESIEHLLVKRSQKPDNSRFLKTLKISDDCWIGIGYDFFNDAWNEISNDIRDLERQHGPGLEGAEKKLFYKFLKDINDIFSKLKLHDRAIIDYYWNEKEEGHYFHMILPFFYVFRNENYKGYHYFRILRSASFLPINTAVKSITGTDPNRKEDYIFFDAKPTGIAHISKDEMLVTFTAGDYRSFEINFGKNDVIDSCVYDISDYNADDTPFKIIDSRSNRVTFQYIINTEKTYIGNFTHKNLKDFIISIESDYRVTLLDRNTLQPSNDYALTLEQLNKLCFE